MSAPADADRRVVEAFFAAFAARDGEAMARCYRPEGSFTDPAFGTLTGAQAGVMWRALMKGARDFRVTHTLRGVEDGAIVVDWVANYLFSKTGRPVENHVTSRIWLRDGLIERQVDHFDFHRWAGQALGLPGRLLGGFGFFQAAVRRKARAGIGLSPQG